MKISYASTLAIAMTIVACNTKTTGQAYAEAKPLADPLRAQTMAAAAIVEKAPAPAADAKCSSPKKLTFDPKSDKHDTDYIMLEDAKRGGAKLAAGGKDEDLDLHFSGPFTILLRGTNGAYDSYMLKDYANNDFLDKLRRAENVKNLIMVRSHGTTIDYFLVTLSTGAIVCSGTFDATADPNLGTHTDDYDTVTKDKRTGKELKRVEHRDTHDDRKSALYVDAKKTLDARMKSELNLNPEI